MVLIEIRKIETFAKWIDGLRDIRARARILVRIERLVADNPGDVKRLVKVFQSCGLIMDLAIGSIIKATPEIDNFIGGR